MPSGTVRALLACLLAAAVAAACSPAPGADGDLALESPLAFDPTCPGRDHLAAEADGRVRAGVTAPFHYSFLHLAEDGCTPVRFNPCEPVHYVTNERLARPEDLADLREALARLSAATGIEFVHDGPTDEEPARRGPSVDRYGSRWAPVLVAWVDDEAMGRIVGAGRRSPADTATTVPANLFPGAGSPIRVGEAIVSGLLVLNVDAVDPSTDRPVAHGFGRGVTWGRVLLHELGHVVGLGHVGSRGNIMQHELGLQTLPTADWGAGDRIALEAVGRAAGCTTTPAFTVTPGR